MPHWLAEERPEVIAVAADRGVPWRGLFWALRLALIVEGLYATAGVIARLF